MYQRTDRQKAYCLFLDAQRRITEFRVSACERSNNAIYFLKVLTTKFIMTNVYVCMKIKIFGSVIHLTTFVIFLIKRHTDLSV